MKNALILHGAGNNSQGNWFPWLKKTLEEKGYKVWLPDLPNSDTPVLKNWLETIFSNKDWEFNEESIIVGHSSGATLILRILENLPKDIKMDKVILVAGFIDKGNFPQFYQYKVDLLKTPFNWNKIKNSCKNFIFIASDNDPYDCGLRHGEIMKKHLGGKLMIMLGEGHFNLEEGEKYKQFPEVLNTFMKSNSLKPELYVSNFQKSLDFYTKILGFKLEYQREDPLFAFLSYQGSHFMIQELDPNEDKEFITGKFEYPFGRGINFQIDTDNVQKLSDSLKEHNYPLRREIKDSWYKIENLLHGCRQILVQDPDGYLLRFSQDIGEKNIE